METMILFLGFILGVQISFAESTCLPLKKNELWLENPKAQGISLLVHGLNFNPQKLTDLQNVLHNQGQAVLRLTLSGHDGNELKFTKVNRNKWLKELKHAFQIVQCQAASKKLPFHFVGHSLGALINEDFLASNPKIGSSYTSQILFAPALAVHTYTYGIEYMEFMGDDYFVPSAAAAEYRACQAGTPIAAYRALFDSLRNFQINVSDNINIPTLVLVDLQDELVSVSGLEEIVRNNGLTNWHMKIISNEENTLKEGAYHHMIVTEGSVGKSEWSRIKGLIKSYLKQKS